MAKSAEIGAILYKLVAAFPGFELKADTIKVYAEMLEDLPADLLLAAAKQHMAESRFFPSISELRSKCRDLSELQSGVETVTEAWLWVCKWIDRSGEGRDPGHELAERAVRAVGGWQQLGQGNTEDRHWVQKRFAEAYGDLLDRERRMDALLPGTSRLLLGDGK